MNLRDKQITVGKVVTILPESKEIFKKVGIDFCCGGHRFLTSAIDEWDLDAIKGTNAPMIPAITASDIVYMLEDDIYVGLK